MALSLNSGNGMAFIKHDGHQCSQQTFPEIIFDECAAGYVQLFIIQDEYLFFGKLFYNDILIQVVELALLLYNNILDLVQYLFGIITQYFFGFFIQVG